MTTIWTTLALGSLAITACAAQTPAAITTPEPTASAAPGDGSAPPTAAATSSAPPTAPSAPAAACPADTKHAFTRIHTQPVTSIGVGEKNRAATYAPGQAALFDGSAFRAIELPSIPKDATVQIFFGRDNAPRLMGFGTDQGDVKSVYFRYRHGRFQPEPSELGPLGSPKGALYGVLGFADPEVVCRPGVTCLVKRLSGWGRAPAHDQPIPIVLTNGSVFALHADRVDQLVKDAWTPVTPARTFTRPSDAWQEPNGALFIAEGAALVRLANGTWTSLPAPIGAINAVFGQRANDLFVAGATGAAHFDGATFRCIPDVPGPARALARVGSDVWIGADTGVYRTNLSP